MHWNSRGITYWEICATSILTIKASSTYLPNPSLTWGNEDGFLIKDYNLEVRYHPSKANVIADALSHKQHAKPLLEEGFNLLHPIVLHNIMVSCSLESQIIELQKTDLGIFCNRTVQFIIIQVN